VRLHSPAGWQRVAIYDFRRLAAVDAILTKKAHPKNGQKAAVKYTPRLIINDQKAIVRYAHPLFILGF
jgi:hypothetical protein